MLKKPQFLSRFRECQECKRKFVVPHVLFAYEVRHNVTIYCPRCDSTNIAQITKKQYDTKEIV